MRYKKGTFTIVPNCHRLSEVPPTAQALFMWLCYYSNEDGECFPARKTLSKNLGCSLRTVDASLQQLEEKGLISKEARFEKNDQKSNLYHLHILGDFEEEGGCKSCTGTGAESARPSCKSCTGGGAKSAHRTIYKGNYPTLTIYNQKNLVKNAKNDDSGEVEMIPKKTEITPAEEARDFFSEGATFAEIKGMLEQRIKPPIVDRELQKFILYWTERNKTGTKQRWEQQKTFEVKRRLRTWLGNVKPDKAQNKGKGLIESV